MPEITSLDLKACIYVMSGLMFKFMNFCEKSTQGLPSQSLTWFYKKH